MSALAGTICTSATRLFFSQSLSRFNNFETLVKESLFYEHIDLYCISPLQIKHENCAFVNIWGQVVHVVMPRFTIAHVLCMQYL